MSPPAVDALLYLLDEAFQGRGIEESSESQALLTNLATVDEATWRAKPPGATRTIESMVLHVGACKTMYDDYAFGTGKKQWGTPEVEGWIDTDAPMAEAIEWLREAHRSFREHVAGLTDNDLDQPRITNWGEINHLRSVLGTDDRWRWQQVEDPA